MGTLFANLYALSTWFPHLVYMGCPYIFYIYMIKCGWLGSVLPALQCTVLCMGHAQKCITTLTFLIIKLGGWKHTTASINRPSRTDTEVFVRLGIFLACWR